MSRTPPVQGRYVLPSYVERTSYGVREMNPYNKLFEERIVFVGAPVETTCVGQMETILARHTGRPVEQVRADIERDRFLTAEEAREYGLIDEIITGRKVRE